MATLELNKTNIRRSVSADVLKAISIFAVVFIHVALSIPNPPAYIYWLILSLRFCVPIFIILWAYFLEKSIEKSTDKYAYFISRFLRLLAPFIFWSMVYFFLSADLEKITIAKIFTKHWFGRGWAGQYYFIILFQLIPLFMAIRYLSTYIVNFYNIMLLFSIVFYIIISYSPLFTNNTVAKISDVLFIYWLPYVFIGVIYARPDKLSYLPVSLFTGLMALVLIPVESVLFRPEITTGSPYLAPSVFVASVLFLKSILNKFVKIKISSKLLDNIISLLACNTLSIFCLNPLMIILIDMAFSFSKYQVSLGGWFIVLAIFSTVMIIGACLSVMLIFKKMRLGILVKN